MNKEDKFKQIINKKWYVQGFNACLNFAFPAPVSGLKGCWEHLGYGYTEKVFILNKDYLEYLYLEEDFKNIGNEFLKHYKESRNYMKEVIAKDHALVWQSNQTMKKIEETDFNKISKEELVGLYQEMWKGYHYFMDVSHIIEGISFVVEPLLKAKLETSLKIDRHDKEFREIFNALMQPAKPSFANDEHLGILDIIKEISENQETVILFNSKEPKEILNEADEKIIQKLIEHRKSFLYNQINYYHGEPISLEDYIAEIKKLLKESQNVEDKIAREIKRYQYNIKKRAELIEEHQFDEDIKDLIHISIETLHWQDDRKKNLLTGVYYMNLLLKEMEKMFNIPLKMLKRYTGDELHLELLNNFNKEDAEERLKQYVVYTKRENGQMITETYLKEDCQLFIDIYQNNFSEKNDIHGTCASAGNCQGIVRVCKTKEDLEGFQEGEILVASMTRPEYVPAMKKAIAIVTDEGGITCHAAIIARELSKPCIIGTKIATKVLKTGDLVDVNAGHGVVKIIKE